MKLPEVRKAYYDASGTASTVARQLGFAGIAIIWIFVQTNGVVFTIPEDLFRPSLVITVGLLFDLLQYASKAFIWGWYGTYKKNKGVQNDADFQAPDFFNWLPLVFFWVKIIAILYAYLLLANFLLTKINFS